MNDVVTRGLASHLERFDAALVAYTFATLFALSVGCVGKTEATSSTADSGSGSSGGVGDAGELSAALEDEITQRFAARVDDTVHAIDGHGVGGRFTGAAGSKASGPIKRRKPKPAR